MEGKLCPVRQGPTVSVDCEPILCFADTDRPDPRPRLLVDRLLYARALLQANGTLGVMDYAVSGSYLDNGRPVEGSRFIGETLQANLGLHLTDAMELR